uniref:Sec-independent protein translocase component TatC n=1 Tax=Fushitsunagia catenata TaxID=1827018 RepID=UPI0026E239D3|nr:Sec-independent protein translocase component TatC [Fushitsunagia catenata]WJJ67937.1 Sec-independent protein translocase component TatC [Fushitsunagia catenata]
MIALYYSELKKRLIYFLLSFFLCFLISAKNFYLLFLVSSYPFLQSFHQKFILTSALDFLELFWFLILNFCFFFTLPFLLYQIFCFFKSSFYTYQINVLGINFNLMCFSLLVNLITCWIILIPTTLVFLMDWSILNQNYSLFLIEIELKILDYIYWLFSFQSTFLNITNFFWIIVLQIYCLIKLEFIYFFMKCYKKIIVFLIIFFFFLCSSTNLSVQLFAISISWSIFESGFFILCFRLRNSKIRICQLQTN